MATTEPTRFALCLKRDGTTTSPGVAIRSGATWRALLSAQTAAQVAMAMLLGVVPAPAHDWYASLKVPGTELLCCGQKDCRPVPDRKRPAAKSSRSSSTARGALSRRTWCSACSRRMDRPMSAGGIWLAGRSSAASSAREQAHEIARRCPKAPAPHDLCGWWCSHRRPVRCQARGAREDMGAGDLEVTKRAVEPRLSRRCS